MEPAPVNDFVLVFTQYLVRFFFFFCHFFG